MSCNINAKASYRSFTFPVTRVKKAIKLKNECEAQIQKLDVLEAQCIKNGKELKSLQKKQLTLIKSLDTLYIHLKNIMTKLYKVRNSKTCVNEKIEELRKITQEDKDAKNNFLQELKNAGLISNDNRNHYLKEREKRSSMSHNALQQNYPISCTKKCEKVMNPIPIIESLKDYNSPTIIDIFTIWFNKYKSYFSPFLNNFKKP